MFPIRKSARAALFLVLLVFAGTALGAQDSPTDYSKLIEEDVLAGYQELMGERLDSDVTDLTWET